MFQGPLLRDLVREGFGEYTLTRAGARRSGKPIFIPAP
jgi:hypothetical protein